MIQMAYQPYVSADARVNVHCKERLSAGLASFDIIY